ncbi:hypothetical protein INT44_004922 [Umbelopsis vinacea]|uniref:Rho-GAP domain-containing protein n=1 Tax=Umbelopsis vinacea TaxID=44442 RepID=A0A8H7UMJ6_9FUNG|nr:hypothetical protein INT44_004922 [Umbelopsis vinacea]
MSVLQPLSPHEPEYKAISTFNIIHEAGICSSRVLNKLVSFSAESKKLPRTQPGVDHESRPIIVLSACKLPDPSVIDYDLILRYELSKEIPTYMMDRNEFVENDYVLVFLAAPAAYRPPWMWLLKAYRSLDRRYKKNLKALHVVHLTRTYRMIFDLANKITSPKFARKLHYYSYLSELEPVISTSQLNLPSAVRPYDEQLQRPNTPPAYASREAKALPGLAFGVSLEKLAEFDNASEADEDYVPSVVKQIIEHLQQNGISQKGIFRKSPSSEELKFVKDELNRGVKIDLSKYDIHLSASLLKVFFRDLPQAPLSLNFVNAVGNITEVTEEFVQHLRTQFHEYYGTQTKLKSLLRYLFSFLHEVSNHSEENLMTAHNIAVIFAPNLLRDDDERGMPDPATYLQQMNKGMGLFRIGD